MLGTFLFAIGQLCVDLIGYTYQVDVVQFRLGSTPGAYNQARNVVKNAQGTYCISDWDNVATPYVSLRVCKKEAENYICSLPSTETKPDFPQALTAILWSK